MAGGKRDLCKRWDRVAANINELKNGYNTSQGYACRDNWGSARYNTAQQLVGLVYDKYNNTSTYKTWRIARWNIFSAVIIQETAIW